jgi:hypothetical protein
MRVIVAAIALVDLDAAGLDAGQPLQLGDDRAQGVAVERVAGQALACSTNWPPCEALGTVSKRRQRGKISR